MKSSFKMIPVLAGMILALLGTVSEAKASNDNSVDTESSYFGQCVGGGFCGTTTEGTLLYGKWHED